VFETSIRTLAATGAPAPDITVPLRTGDEARARRRAALALAGSVITLLLCPAAVAQSNARVDDSASSKELAKVRRAPGARTAVAIYEFRSAVPEVPVGAAQEMFVTALIKSGAFAVAERQRLNEGVMRERQLNASGITTGPAAGQVAAARYMFEVVVSEANRGASESAQSVNIGGMTVGGGKSADAIGLDVRIVDVQTGLVMDAVNTVKTIEASSSNVSGVGNLLGALRGLAGKTMPVTVDAESRSSRKEGVDRALRACIEVAVAELARRLVAE
jgi:curli biogenesis system outer membrane secretion channel CsgG